MTRRETIEKMIQMAKEITGENSENWTRDKENAIWDICYDWNREHYDGHYDEAEIFMCEMWKADGYEHDGFFIEDDYFCYLD